MKIRTIPAGIEWKPVRRNHWLVTIRREPETVYEWEPGDLAQSASALGGSLLPGSWSIYPTCPCCGQPRQPAYDGALGGIFGLE